MGISSILFGSVAVLSSLWHARYNHKDREPSTMLVVWLMYFFACVPMILDMNIWTVFIFLIVNEISKALLGVSYFSFMFRAIKDLPKSGLRTELMVMREILLNIGRILSVILFITLYLFARGFIYYYLLAAIFVQGLLFIIVSKSRSGITIRNGIRVKHEI